MTWLAATTKTAAPTDCQGHGFNTEGPQHSSTVIPTSKDMDVVFNDSGHLKFLYLRAEPFGQQNKDVHVLLAPHTLDG